MIERYSSDSPQYVIDKAQWAYQFRTEWFPKADQIIYNAQSLAMPTTEEAEFISEKATVLETYASELLADLILGNKSLDDLPEYLKEMESLGLSEYLSVLQARRDRLAN